MVGKSIDKFIYAITKKPIDEYLLLDRDCFNDNYEEQLMNTVVQK